jgi:hypothetical protein
MAMDSSPAGTKGMLVMRKAGAFREHAELKDLVVEASRSLARLDADRLEELALSCQALNRDLAPASKEERAVLARQAREAAGDMAVFARVLEATRANLNVMNRLRELRAGRLEYSQTSWKRTEAGHGHN